MHTCEQKVPLVKKLVNYMARKGLRLVFRNSSSPFLMFWFNSHISLTIALTIMKLGREMKFSDPTNNVKFKSMSFLGKQQQTTSSNTL